MSGIGLAQRYTYSELLHAAENWLRTVDGEMCRETARQLVAAATDRTQAQLVADFPLTAFMRDVRRVNDLVQRHINGEPVAYILGSAPFHGLTLTVTPDVLIPRDDTEALCDLAIRHLYAFPPGPRVLDLCAGSGCIGLAIASEIKDATVTLGEISPAAIRVARANIRECGLGRRVSCLQIDAREKPSHFLGLYDMIVSNPPYVTAAQMENLDRSVREYEPRIALYGGPDGLDFYRSITDNFGEILKPGGCICFEFGIGQGPEVTHILMTRGYQLSEIVRDNQGIERAVLAYKPAGEEEKDYGNEEDSI